MDGQQFTNPILYKPLGSSGTFVSCRCSMNQRVDWWSPQGMKVLACGSKMLSTNYCVDNSSRRTRTLNFTAFMLPSAGNYTCRGKHIVANLSINVLG